MGRFRPEDSIEVSQKQKVPFNEKEFVSDVFHNNYILVVGSEALLNAKEYMDVNNDMNQYLLDTINQTVFKKRKGDAGYYTSFSAMQPEHSPKALVQKQLFEQPNFKLELSDLSEELKDLLETRLFRIVFTTSYDDLLEKAMESIWGTNLKVVDINDMDSLREFQEEVKECTTEDGSCDYDRPTLFYIFGKARNPQECPDNKFVVTDNDAIEIICRWMNGDSSFKQITDFVAQKKILSVGCNFEDWHMRFFWYILKRNIANIHRGKVVSSSTSDGESTLVSYLEQNQIYHEADTRDFVKRITKLLKLSVDNYSLKDIIVRYRRKGSIFLSYHSKDFDEANNLFNKLYNAGFGVWFDNKDLFGGDDYDERIDKAISKCKVFLPLLTTNIKNILQNIDLDHTPDKDVPYFIKEWMLARQTEGATIIPVAKGFPLRDENLYKHIFEERIIGHACSGIDLNAKDGMDKLKQSLDHQLKK